MVKNDFERGFFCAVAKMIQMEGVVNPTANELFRGCDWTKADDEDKQVFVEYGLIPAVATTRIICGKKRRRT